jgi:hypothetical protein
MTKAIQEICRKTSAGAFVLSLGVLASCGVPSAGCGDGVVCLEDGAASGEAATASDIKVGKYAYSPNGEIIEGKLNASLESASTKIRDFGTAVLTLAEEALAPNSSGYRVAPVSTDGEMRMIPDPPAAPRSPGQLSLANYSTDCGKVGNVTNRILDCKDNYSAAATWTGSEQGIYAETTWVLVTRDSSAGTIIWKDTGTGYLWTSKIATNVNFCAAAGADNGYGPVTCAGNDVAKLSYCSENTGFSYPAGVPDKLGNLSLASGKVQWRLPTRADFLKAELDGLRYVHEFDLADNFWSSNVWSQSAGNIWTYSADGSIKNSTTNSDTSTDVICVGVEETEE